MNESMMNQTPSTVLKNEHQVILRVLRVLESLVNRMESGENPQSEALSRCVEFFRLFADACHHAKEEDILFPMLESRGIPRDGGPIGVMLHEHTQARAFTKEMGEAVQKARISADEWSTEVFPTFNREAADQTAVPMTVPIGAL